MESDENGKLIEAYRRGLREGESRSKRLINCMCRTNVRLLELVKELDVELPLTGVTISFDMAEKIIKSLKSKRADWVLAEKLQKLLNEKYYEIQPGLEQARQEVEEILKNS